MDKIESLLLSKDLPGAKRWQPTKVTQFEQALSTSAVDNMKKEIKKNISYSLQYLHFLQVQINELNLTSVIYTQIFKSYVIVSCGIIECLFHYLLKEKGLYKKEEWLDLIEKKYSSAFIQHGEELRYLIVMQKKVQCPVDTSMDFNEMINKIEHKKLLNSDHGSFTFLRELRKLRNRVLLQVVNSLTDTDYFSFSKEDYVLASNLLYMVLMDDAFALDSQGKSVFRWLKV